MLHTKLIRDLDELRTLAFPPPYALQETLETAEGRGEAWWVLMAHERYSEQARWVVMFPEEGESWFFTDGDRLRGRWDPEREIFLPDEGPPLDLRGNPVSLASIEEDEEEEDAEEEERRR
ncbi:hypothetical protein [Geothrix campi]|jgi:hypothetical protein|uniref:hypothetical protein n=1 Tax=Geothrix campi TaxID=2966450 RepID=UPI0021475489|nr:hypothetical protein [Geothrix sp. SG10]